MSASKKRSLYLIVISLVLIAMVPTTSASQRISEILAVRGKALAGCRLTNMSVGAAPDSPINPSLPTYVITHGYNPLPGFVRLSTPEAYASKLRACHGNQINVLTWHWDSRGQGSHHRNNQNATRSGRGLANALIARGVVPEQTTMIGHSMGAVVISKAANCIFYETGRCTQELVLIDAPKRRLPIILHELNVTECATVVKNVWASGLSGVGAPVNDPRVMNIAAPSRRRRIGCRGPLCVARNNHMDVVLWYYQNCL